MAEMMRAVVATAPGKYELQTLPVPEPGEEDILIRVEACGICAGDIKASHGTARFWGGDGMPGYCKPPFIPGHEFYGRVVKMGPKAKGGFKVGDRIISEQIVPCGECYYCKRGMYWLCDPHDVYGFKNYLNGGMAEYTILPKGSLNSRVPESLTLEQAALIEPYACSFHGVKQGQIGPDDTVVIAGAGTLGLGMVNAMNTVPRKKLIVLDMINKRLGLAKKFGADVVLNPGTCNVIDEVLKLTDGVGCDVYIEATGNPAAVQQGIDLLRKGGTFVEFSVMSGPSTIDWSLIGDARELTIRGSQLSPHCYPEVIEAMAAGKLHTDGVITHKFDLADFEEAYRTAQTKEALKVLFVMPESKS